MGIPSVTVLETTMLDGLHHLFVVGDRVAITEHVSSLTVSSRDRARGGNLSYGSFKGRRGRIVQINHGNANGRTYAVRLDGRKVPVWFRASEMAYIEVLDRLAEIE